MGSISEEVIIKLLEKILEIQKDQLNILSNIYRTFSKYDAEYLTEMEKEGHKTPQQ